MLHISDDEVYESLALENPWWEKARTRTTKALPKRSYFQPFMRLVEQTEVRRSVILLGPRRVGKTVILLQTIDHLLDQGVLPRDLLYVSLDRPLYNGRTPEQIVRAHEERHPNRTHTKRYFFFDEIQYVRDWQYDLKSLTDLYPHYRFVASGSAAAALRAQSQESGAGRFTDFFLPPLTFDEFLAFQTTRTPQSERLDRFADEGFEDERLIDELDIAFLNILFERYLTYGGYPEAVLSSGVQSNLNRFVREDIVEKVLLRDLPGLYGIGDTRELNSLFTTLCYNTAQEVSLEALSQSSAVAKNTIKRYLEYLEAAFLTRSIYKIDQNAKRFQRQSAFKIYLTNPSLRAALFRSVSQDDEMFGHMAETAVFSQWFHSPLDAPLHYARWPQGEIDLVHLSATRQKPAWFAEIKWSDRHVGSTASWKPIAEFVRRHDGSLESGLVTSRTRFASRNIEGVEIRVVPTAIYCWQVGRNVVDGRFDPEPRSVPMP